MVSTAATTTSGVTPSTRIAQIYKKKKHNSLENLSVFEVCNRVRRDMITAGKYDDNFAL